MRGGRLPVLGTFVFPEGLFQDLGMSGWQG